MLVLLYTFIFMLSTLTYLVLAVNNHQPGSSTSSVLLTPLLLSLLSRPLISLLPPLPLSPPSLSSLYLPFQ